MRYVQCEIVFPPDLPTNDVGKSDTVNQPKKKNLDTAKKVKNDEFYTKMEDIEHELLHYKHIFKGKTVYCNCDDPRKSNFSAYFRDNFSELGIKKLICTCYRESRCGLLSIQTNAYDTLTKELKGSGDFRSDECAKFLSECDIIVTNPPFSLFREYIQKIFEYGKQFLIIGSQNAITYKEVYKLIQDDKVWLGYTTPKAFKTTLTEINDMKKQFMENGEVYQKFGNICWFTNMITDKRLQPIPLTESYDESKYEKYSNYDAIEVPKVKLIPKDYDGVMGVPISFLNVYSPLQFEIVKFRKGDDDKDLNVNGECPYFRILIRKRVVSQ